MAGIPPVIAAPRDFPFKCDRFVPMWMESPLSLIHIYFKVTLFAPPKTLSTFAGPTYL